MVEYIASKNPQYYYNTILVESLVMTHHVDGNPMEITGCMKPHLIVFKFKKNVFCKEYICDCTYCQQFDFKNYSNENAVDNDEDDADLEELDKKNDQTEQIFDFVTVPSFVFLFSESTI